MINIGGIDAQNLRKGKPYLFTLVDLIIDKRYGVGVIFKSFAILNGIALGAPQIWG